jgi:hypothetical protein
MIYFTFTFFSFIFLVKVKFSDKLLLIQNYIFDVLLPSKIGKYFQKYLKFFTPLYLSATQAFFLVPTQNQICYAARRPS